MTEDFNIRALKGDDWKQFIDVRLEALSATPHMFGASLATESALNENDIRTMLENDKQRIFGLFDQDRLIGLNAVFTDRNDASGKTALLAMWYLNAEYRGRGLFDGLVKESIDWAEREKRFDKIIVSHRAGNDASRAANQRAGFTYTGKKLHVWGDGSYEFNHYYERRLR